MKPKLVFETSHLLFVASFLKSSSNSESKNDNFSNGYIKSFYSSDYEELSLNPQNLRKKQNVAACANNPSIESAVGLGIGEWKIPRGSTGPLGSTVSQKLLSQKLRKVQRWLSG